MFSWTFTVTRGQIFKPMMIIADFVFQGFFGDIGFYWARSQVLCISKFTFAFTFLASCNFPHALLHSIYSSLYFFCLSHFNSHLVNYTFYVLPCYPDFIWFIYLTYKLNLSCNILLVMVILVSHTHYIYIRFWHWSAAALWGRSIQFTCQSTCFASQNVIFRMHTEWNMMYLYLNFV